jgi:hypothetical protein
MSDEMHDSGVEEEATFKAQVHGAIRGAQQARRDASRSYAETRERLIEQAKATGSKDPERDAGRVHAMMLRDLDKRAHRDVHAVFLNHGWSRDKQDVAFEPSARSREQEFKEGRLEQAEDSRARSARRDGQERQRD